MEMKNVSSMKTNKTDSPKTPGGISKALLTPCRRVGLSRNWRKGGPSPFVSPLAGSGETKQPVQTKRTIDDVDLEKSKTNINPEINTTPSRHVDIPRRKKSKILKIDPDTSSQETEQCFEPQESINSPPNEIINEDVPVVTPVLKNKSRSKKNSSTLIKGIPIENTSLQISSSVANNKEIEVTPVLKSKSIKITSPAPNNTQGSASDVKIIQDNVASIKSRKNSMKVKKNSPDNLAKECIVVLQNKIFKDQVVSDPNDKNEQKSTWQTLFDSDSDEVPLCNLSKHLNENVINNTERADSTIGVKAENLPIQPRVLTLEDDDFMENSHVKVQKLEDKTTSTSSLKKTVKKKPKENKQPIKISQPPPSSQSSDDDDFDFDHKRTILIRKSYDKVTKPLKAKSTGSITQKDIDDLRSRIEVKKKLLLAKAMNKDTEELRGLIKKWQRGCQDALTELIEMMRNKCPDKQNMDFSEMLQILKIPSSLVGYDEENDCFNTPDDASVVLAKFNDL
ncbi:uncharacterized protein LOC106139985 [Amyelois transitella]|uniref:uncharacterized protein LOC106139985 n=1 Tax=Amyelois transitella TaxID=680683 RepID=UPI0029904FA3|nr:uncharacterized protein LOC106139985 [Amyelois transitella]